MTLFIFFAVVFATIIFAIVLQRIINCPILVGFAFFAAFLVIAAIFNSVTLVIVAIALGILAFIVAFLDCIFRRSGFFRNSGCLSCNSDDDDDNNCCNCCGRRRGRNSIIPIESNCNSNCNSDCNCRNNCDETLTILNSNGQVVARMNGNILNTQEVSSSNCGCTSRNCRR